MKIKAVIVDWLPEACFDCEFEGSKRCILACELLDYTRYETRPDWCPLMLEGWISVEDRLPEVEGRCLVIESYGEPYIANYDKGWKIVKPEFITHWKPIPDPPNGNKK